MRRAALEQTTTMRSSYIQARRLIGGILGPYMRVTLGELRDLVAATEDYSEWSEVRIESTSVRVIETRSSGYRSRGRETAEAADREDGSHDDR